MDTGGNMKTSPANTSLTGHGNNNEQSHVNQHVTNDKTSKTQTQRDDTEIENKGNLISDKNGPADTGINIQIPIDKKQKTTNDNYDKQEIQNPMNQNREGDWSTVTKKARNNGHQKQQRQNVMQPTATNGIQEFTMTDIVEAIDQDKYAVPAFRGSIQISLTEGKDTTYDNENTYIPTVKKFFQLLKQLDPTVMIMAWDSSIKNDPITMVEELTKDKFEKFYSINRRLSDNNKRIDMTILIASAIQLHVVLKKGRPYKELQRNKWYVHLTERRYVGPQMSIGWLLEIHPVFTNVFTLKDEIVNNLKGISKHISLGQKTEKWKYNDERGRQQTTHVRVLCVQAPKEMGPQIQKDLFEQWKNLRETQHQDNKSTMSGGMFIPYDVEVYDMKLLLAKQEKFLKQYQYSVVLYKCRTLTKEFTVPATVANILAIETGKTTTLQDLLLSMTVTNTSEKLVRSIERIDGKRFQLIVHKDNIEMCRLHMQNTLELLRNNVDNWHNITETEEGASLAPNGYTRAIMISPEKLKSKKTFLTKLAQDKQLIKAPKSNYHHTWQAGEAWGSRGIRGGRGGRDRVRNHQDEQAQATGGSKLILSTNQTQNNGGGYTVDKKLSVEEKIEKQFQLHAEARAKEDEIEQQLTKISGKYLNDLIEKDNRQEDMEFALETIQSNKGMEAMFKQYISEAVVETTKAQTLAIAELEDRLNAQSQHNTATMKIIQEKMANDTKEQYEYNDTVHNLFRSQFERLETAFQRNDTALKTEFKAMADYIQENDQRRDKNTMDMFNVMLTKMNEGNFTPISDNRNCEKQENNTIPFTDPTVTPVKQYATPVNETSQTPIELDDSEDEKCQQQKDRKEHTTETTITQEDLEAMEAVMQQSKEDTKTCISNKSKPELQADVHALKDNSFTKLTTLKSKYSQSKENSTKYQAPNTRSTRSKSRSDLGKGK